MKKLIALYKCMSADYETIQEVEDYYESSTDFVRLTMPVEIDFMEVPKEETIPQQISYLNKKVDEIRAEAQKQISYVETKKAELLALPSLGEA